MFVGFTADARGVDCVALFRSRFAKLLYVWVCLNTIRHVMRTHEQLNGVFSLISDTTTHRQITYTLRTSLSKQRKCCRATNECMLSVDCVFVEDVVAAVGAPVVSIGLGVVIRCCAATCCCCQSVAVVVVELLSFFTAIC